MRNMSFALTTKQFRARTKSVTRRVGWANLKPGDVVMGVEKGMGLKPGEKVVRLGAIRILGNVREKLSRIKKYPLDETAKEGFPEKTAAEFVTMFCEHMRCKPSKKINRIEFEYL